MTALLVQGLAKYWGVDLLFKEISFLLNQGEKMALVGRNGTGKTTLMKILMGQMEYDEGSINLGKGLRIGYLSQDPDFTPGNTLLTEAESAFAYLKEWERELRDLEARMGSTADPAEMESILASYSALTERFESAGGYGANARTRSVLFGLGFVEADLEKPVEVLSGGQKVRLGLAKLLLEAPDVMLLDEPTNHLDLHAVEWLEGYFKSMKSAAILVSHDRYFLDKVITRTLELENHTMELYHGNYSYFLDEKERRNEAAWDAYDHQQAEMKELEEFYLKWRLTPSRKNQAMERKKRLEKLQEKALPQPRTRFKRMKLRFDLHTESGDDVLKVESLTKSFSGRPVLGGVDARLSKGQQVALVGPNGAGKTTFLRILQGLLPADRGTVFWGVGVKRGYFSQDLDHLDYNRTAMEEMLELPGYTKFDAHSLLGRFLFSGDDVHKRIAECSGGERNRLTLAKLVVSGSNVLLLDEPTNHLDMESKQVLEEALTQYPGTILFVSHDRYFVDRVATDTWEFDGGKVTMYEGNYSAYRAEKERLAQIAAERLAAEAAATAEALDRRAAPAAEPEQMDAKEARAAQAAQRREERKQAQQLAKVEAEIQRLEARKAELEESMADPDLYRSESGRAVVSEFNAVQAELERLYLEWGALAE